jgi:hypothetical protein
MKNSILPLSSIGSDNAQYLISGLRGCVVQNSDLREEIRISFVLTGGYPSKVGLYVDGWYYASGMVIPSDRTNMDPRFNSALEDFSQKLIGAFNSYLSQELQQ